MAKVSLPTPPDLAVKAVLQTLPSKRMRDVLEKRYGLKGGRRKTLEAIGREYNITRERVRQIEADAFRHLSREEVFRDAEPVVRAIEAAIVSYGGAIAEHHLFETIADTNVRPHVAFLLEAAHAFWSLPDSPARHKLWGSDENRLRAVERVLAGVEKELASRGAPVAEDELRAIVARIGEKEFGHAPSERAVDAILASSKMIKKNPYGEYGLISWPVIRPRGVRDKAYVALLRAGKPLHFTEVAQAITDAGWSKRRAHPQTVHNELIKDSRFVLVGRGSYALREWGYEPGLVRDVIAETLKKAGRPLTKDQIARLVLQKRLVKPPTVFLNLQNKALFKRLDDGTYTLV